ncbi:MAG: ferrous iron transport protein B [Desulfurococcales archaeon]|nr:ferrous iron transport protein B [Desulfurococcales archaeon]
MDAAVQAQQVDSALRNCDRIVALVGVPNTGKSTLFTVLTGRHATIANWPGVTVDIEVGKIRSAKGLLCIVDLPGTYGLIPSSPEEAVTRRFLTKYKPDTIVVVLDMSQPEVSFSLLVQVVEAFPGRVLVAGTKAELAHSLGVHVDLEGISRLLHVPVVRTSALEGVGVRELLDAILSGRRGGRLRIDYGVLEPFLEHLENHPESSAAAEKTGFSKRWIALGLMGGDEYLYSELHEHGLQSLASEGLRLREEFQRRHGLDPEHVIVEKRLEFIEKLARETVIRRKPASSFWQRIADLHMHPILGPFVSILGLLITFMLVFSVNTGFPLNIVLEYLGHPTAAEILSEYSISGVIAMFFDALSSWVVSRVPGLVGDLLGNGIINGVGFVLSFTPLIAMVYLSLAILEDSGIATRMAVSFHGLFRRFGLSGKSVFPLVMGLGCNVPAVFSARALSEEERFRAVFAVPFIPCQARLAVIVAFVTVLIRGVAAQAMAVVTVYVEALLAALLTSWIAARIVQPRIYARLGIKEYTPTPELIMEIPPVHRPHPKVVWWMVRDNTLHFLRKAGTIIFLLAILLWGIFAFGPSGVAGTVEESYAYLIGEAAGKVLAPFHLSDRARNILGTALVSGIIAKEGVLTTIAIATGSATDASAALKVLGIGPAQALGYLVLISLYFPCIATLAAMVSVLKSRGLVVAYAIYSFLLALVLGYVTYLAAAALIG